MHKPKEGLQTQINDYDRQIKVLQDTRAESKKQLDCTKPNWIKYSKNKNNMEEEKKAAQFARVKEILRDIREVPKIAEEVLEVRSDGFEQSRKKNS